MRKEFNDTGTCLHDKHYMVDIKPDLQEIKELVDKEKYFMINRPRQYGKTTIMAMLEDLLAKDDYLVISISFEGIGDSPFESKKVFCPFFLRFLSNQFMIKKLGLTDVFKSRITNELIDFETLSLALTDIMTELDKKVVLMVDEVDKSSNNQLFLHFLGMLRDKYLLMKRKRDLSFHSVILAGLHDVKNLKLKLRPDEEAQYNSPWNIAVDFNLDMTFHPKDIETMLIQYSNETGTKMNIEEMAEEIYFYTNGYPYFVSKLCKIIDEELKPEIWEKRHIVDAVKFLINIKNNTNFDTLIKNLENNKKLYEIVKKLLIGSESFPYDYRVPIINFGEMHGIFTSKDNKLIIHNKIYEVVLTSYITGKIRTENTVISSVQSTFIKPDGKLDMKLVITKFQNIIEEKYSKSSLMKSNEFLENELRMQFLIYLQPIINGIGFAYKEVQISEEKRLDVIVIFKDEKFIIELKLWYGEKYHNDGIKQIKGYMQREHLNEAYMIIMDKRKDKKFKQTDEDGIFTVWM